MPIACAQSIPQRTATTSAMRRFVATRALRAASSSAAQRATRSAPSLAAVRAITTSRARLAGERLTNEGAKASRYGDVWQILKDHVQDRGVNLVGDAAVVVFYVALFGRISYKLMPSRMQPNVLMSESVQILANNREVTARIGSPVIVSRDSDQRIGFPTDHVDLKDKDGKPRLRIKYELEGPEGHVQVFAEAAKGSQKGEYVYLILKFNETGEVVNIYDNRRL